jgi:hypothetical protein
LKTLFRIVPLLQPEFEPVACQPDGRSVTIMGTILGQP